MGADSPIPAARGSQSHATRTTIAPKRGGERRDVSIGERIHVGVLQNLLTESSMQLLNNVGKRPGFSSGLLSNGRQSPRLTRRQRDPRAEPGGATPPAPVQNSLIPGQHAAGLWWRAMP